MTAGKNDRKRPKERPFLFQLRSERRSSPIAASGAFSEDGSFSLLVHLMNEEIGTIRMQASFSDDSVSLCSHLCGEFSFRGFEGSATGILEKHGALE